jgi:hypothetical protein
VLDVASPVLASTPGPFGRSSPQPPVVIHASDTNHILVLG